MSKHLEGKARPTDIYLSLIRAISSVRAYGSNKYGDRENWRTNAAQVYVDSALRHIYAYAEGEECDSESGLPHLHHAACNIMFLIECDLAAADAKIEYGERNIGTFTVPTVDD